MIVSSNSCIAITTVQGLCVCVGVCHLRIGKATGYKMSELSGLVEESTLVIGGKQIEVHYTIHYYCAQMNNWKMLQQFVFVTSVELNSDLFIGIYLFN